MSLPDTVFIFVLALIIFGPKKLPEIGRQIGKLVGEFRRASNEFKFQIEEELRQADILDKPSTRQTIAAPLASPTAAEAVQSPVLAEFAADPAANLPVGQHPNIDSFDTSELNGSGEHLPEAGESELRSAAVEPGTPQIVPAEGSLARTTAPFASVLPPDENTEVAEQAESEHASSPVGGSTGAEHIAAAVPAPAPAEAEISRG